MKIVIILEKRDSATTGGHSPAPGYVADLVKRLVSDSGITEITIKREAEG